MTWVQRLKRVFNIDIETGRGRVVYQYKQPFRDGLTHVALEPLPTYKLIQFRTWPTAAISDAEKYTCRMAALWPAPEYRFLSLQTPESDQ